MERSRAAARLTGDEAPLSLTPSPALRSRVEARAPGANRADVDALLRGLAGPLAEGKSARERADVLLDILQDAQLGGVMGSDARPVRTAALEALLALLGTWKRRRALTLLGSWPMGLVGLAVMLFAYLNEGTITPVLFCLGAARFLAALCLGLPKGEE